MIAKIIAKMIAQMIVIMIATKNRDRIHTTTNNKILTIILNLYNNIIFFIFLFLFINRDIKSVKISHRNRRVKKSINRKMIGVAIVVTVTSAPMATQGSRLDLSSQEILVNVANS
jgi:glycerol uptake facilitator-like aquaporin